MEPRRRFIVPANIRGEWRGPQGAGMQTGRAIPRPLHCARSAIDYSLCVPFKPFGNHVQLAIHTNAVKLPDELGTKLGNSGAGDPQVTNAIPLMLVESIADLGSELANPCSVRYVAWTQQNPIQTNGSLLSRILKIDCLTILRPRRNKHENGKVSILAESLELANDLWNVTRGHSIRAGNPAPYQEREKRNADDTGEDDESDLHALAEQSR